MNGFNMKRRKRREGKEDGAEDGNSRLRKCHAEGRKSLGRQEYVQKLCCWTAQMQGSKQRLEFMPVITRG
jgi:hypothetical protein